MPKTLSLGNFNFPPPKSGDCDLLVIAGEHSGDEQSARMLEAAFLKKPSLKVCAFGGKNLEKAGAQLLFEMTSFSVVGLMEVLKNYKFFSALSEAVANWISLYKPKAVCFVDYPGFNLHLAKVLKRRGISVAGGGNVKLLYYIGPQIWAWKAGRRFKMAELLDELAVIFPFEPACYADTNLSVNFVGHPFAEEKYVSPVSYNPQSPILFLAGSRPVAVSRIFPVMLGALKLLESETAVALYPNETIKDVLQKCLKNFPDLKGRVSLVKNSQNISGKAVLMSSGTMSLSCCLEGIPGAIVYKANPITYVIGRLLVKIKYLGIANIILNKPAWKEFIQFDARPKPIADHLKRCIENVSARKEAEENAGKLRQVLLSSRKISAADWLEKHAG